LIDLSNKAISDNFIPLDLWNKFDKVIDYLSSISDFKITNHIYHQIEKFSSARIACGDDVIQALDGIFAYKILPCYAKCNIVRKGDVTLSECIDNVFGLENLPLSGKAMVDLGLDR
jgi:hypothetical protein